MEGNAEAWARQARPFVGAPPLALRETQCCAQFLVSRDRIQARPRVFWESLLEDLLDASVPQSCKLSEHVLELSWAWLLGEPIDTNCTEDGWGAGRPATARERSTPKAVWEET